jgi:hypothetical protein
VAAVPDHPQVRICGAPPLDVTLEEVELERSSLHGRRGPSTLGTTESAT